MTAYNNGYNILWVCDLLEAIDNKKDLASGKI